MVNNSNLAGSPNLPTFGALVQNGQAPPEPVQSGDGGKHPHEVLGCEGASVCAHGQVPKLGGASTVCSVPAVVGLFTGLLAKEVMVGSLDAIYSKNTDDGDATIGEQLQEALQSIPDNAAGLADALIDPLGLSLTEIDKKLSFELVTNFRAGFSREKGTDLDGTLTSKTSR